MSDTLVLPESPVAGYRQGDVIAGKYRLDHELGRGAMGTVWAATHVTLGQRVAIKLIAGEQARSPDARQRFSVEAKAAARLKSRNAVQVYDDGETQEGVPYIVMEYLDGETLEARLERQGDIGLPEAVRITTHVGRALARAHARGIVHRDLKCGNVFIARTDDDELGWVAKVLDFGVAKLADMANASTTKTGTILGTPLFMSPEQIRGASHVDLRADLYSLGMVFYNMVTGNHAFNGPSYSDVLVAICTEPLPDIRERAPWLPETVRDWFGKACAREADDRFQSADEMLEALREAAGPLGRLARHSAPDEASGPSGTLMGHVPPHAMATVRADTPVTEPPPATNDTLRSRTGPYRARESQGDSGSRVSIAESKKTWSYAVLVVVGAGAAVMLVAGLLALRWTLHFVMTRYAEKPKITIGLESPSSLPPAPSPGHEALVPSSPAEPMPSAPPVATRAAEPTPSVEIPAERPRHASTRSARPAAARPPSVKPERSAAPEAPKPASGPTAPDMGF